MSLPNSVEEMTDIIDIVGISPSPWFNVIKWSLVILLVFLLLWLVIMVLRRISKRKKEAVSLSPKQRAVKSLDLLNKADLISKRSWQKYYFTLDIIFRRYVYEEFDYDVLDRTVEELKVKLPEVYSKVPNIDLDWYKQFLERIQLIKFAQESSSADDCQQDYEQVSKFIKRVKND